MAEGLLRHHLALSGLAKNFQVKSAGTRVSSPGARPDQRAIRVASAAGINLGRIRAKKVTERMLRRNDLIIAMDRSNLEDLRRICPEKEQFKLSLLSSHVPGLAQEDIPDPYYGSVEGFGEVFRLIQEAIPFLIPKLGQVNPIQDPESA
jgi:protein-tyrosine phosphatase